MVNYACSACMWCDQREPVRQPELTEALVLCRKHRQIVYQDKSGYYRSAWPLVRPSDFCGEWMPDKAG